MRRRKREARRRVMGEVIVALVDEVLVRSWWWVW